MANETIELLKNYEAAKMQWPAMHQQKLDGVPIRLWNKDGVIGAYTRQGESIVSVPHIVQFGSALLKPGDSVVMELYIEGKPFKEISGKVRKRQACRELVGWIWDADWATYPGGRYDDRRATLVHRLSNLAEIAGCSPADLPCRVMPGSVVASPEEADSAAAGLLLAYPDAEGSVMHSLQKTFQPGKRCWGTQRMKPVPTIDLRVLNFEEAISEDGRPLGMVGRLNAEFNRLSDLQSGLDTTIIGVGPGCLTHSERKSLWQLQKSGNYTPSIAEIRYMRDETYDALRQPTFLRWRPDKKDGEVVEA